MKVQGEEVLKCLDTIEGYFDGMVQGAREWCTDETTRDMIYYVQEQVRSIIVRFKFQHLTPKEQTPAWTPGYLKAYDRIQDPEHVANVAEGEVVYKTDLYCRIIRQIKLKDISQVKTSDLRRWIEDNIVGNFEEVRVRLIYTDQFFYTSMQVIDDVVKSIELDRARAPQQKLFNE